MSNNEFWEDEPQLYWAYRFSYIEKLNRENEVYKFRCWLQGRTNELSVEIGVRNVFSKKKAKYPTYEQMFRDYEKINENKEELKQALTGVASEEKISELGFNFWARI